MKNRGRNMTFEDRVVIESMRQEGHSMSDIAKRLNRSRATISRELKANAHPYNAQAAQNNIFKAGKR